jgi:formylglycine-generating enzyme required for sulfatase activity
VWLQSEDIEGPPMTLRPLGIGGGQFQMLFYAPPGLNCTVQGSEDLVTWTTVQEVRMPQEVIEVRDAAAGHRFYRVVIPLAGEREGFVWIPPGTFLMGSPDSEPDRHPQEGPQTQVTITRGFWAGRHEVTQGEYEALMGSNPSFFKGDPRRPVEMVSWYDATNYCAKLTERESAAGRLPAGYVYRLPTDAEWEYLCRAGTTTRFSFGDDPGYIKLGDYAWYAGNSGGQSHPVETKPPNPWGLYDLPAIVWEWCMDWWSESLPGGTVTDPKGPADGSVRVIRGGSWSNAGFYARSAFRGRGDPAAQGDNLGFRVVLAPSLP